MLRYGGHYRGSTCHDLSPSTDDDGEILEAKWRDWVERESFKRYVPEMTEESVQRHIANWIDWYFTCKCIAQRGP
jgi:hypothetical protein